MWTTFKLSFIAVVLALTVSEASASCDAPELELELEHEFDNSRGYDTEATINFGISWTLGDNTACKREEALQNDLLIREIRKEEAETANEHAKTRKEEAETRKEKAEALQEELDALQQKIAICSKFDTDTAPGSIRILCGDLLQ